MPIATIKRLSNGNVPRTFYYSYAILMARFSPSECNIQEPYHLPFDYDPFSRSGPPRWRRVDVTGNEWEKFVGKELIDLDIDGNECRSDRRPAPVNLVATDACFDNHEILTRKIRDTDCKFDDLTFSITPHSLRASFPHDDVECLRPTIDLPNGYPYRWHAHFVELHIRAEHVLDGRRYDGELQMVHLGQMDQKRELSTVSVMLDASAYEDDPRLQQYIDEWQRVADGVRESCRARRRDEETGRGGGNAPEAESGTKNLRGESGGGARRGMRVPARDFSQDSFNGTRPLRAADDPEHREGKNGRDLQEGEEVVLAPRKKGFPYDIWPTIYFYRYRGSITYPPCSEIVSWRILDEPLLISRRQFKQLARLLVSYVDEDTCENDTAASPTGETYRPLQQHNHQEQELSHCTAKDYTFWMYPPHQV